MYTLTVLESLLAFMVSFSTETASFMNGCRIGNDTGVPSGTHKLALINFLSKRDSDLRRERARRGEKWASSFCLPLLALVSSSSLKNEIMSLCLIYQILF